MLSLRIVAAGAVVLFACGTAAGGAAAQSATADTPGKPLELLRIIEQPLRPKVAAHSRFHAAIHRSFAARSKRHSVIAEAKAQHPTAQDAAPAIVPDDNSAPAAVATTEPALQPVPPLAEPAIGELVVGNRTVALASQSDVNEIDLAADATGKRSANLSPSNAKADDAAANAAPSVPTTATPASAVISDSGSKSDSIKNAPAPQPQAARSTVGSPGWIAQVMAAAAGAVAAGSLAWFLIGSAPQRTYG